MADNFIKLIDEHAAGADDADDQRIHAVVDDRPPRLEQESDRLRHRVLVEAGA